MKTSLITFVLFVALIFLIQSCDKDGNGEDTPTTPSNLQLNAEVIPDGSGLVKFTASADNAIVFYYFYGESINETGTASSNGNSEYSYSKPGTNTFTVRVEAAARGGATIEKSITINVTVSYEPPSSITRALTGGASKNWFWKNTQDGHLGLGPVNSSEPSLYSTYRDEKLTLGCLYDDVMTFIDNGDGTYGYQLNNKGDTYFQADVYTSATGQTGNGSDQCGTFNTTGTKSVLFRPITSSSTSPSTGVSLSISNEGFLSFGAGSSTYEIMSITDTELRVRTLALVDGQERAWYHTFGIVSELGQATFTGASGSGNNDVLVWADEFNDNGAPNNGNWIYNIGTGDNGWGNSESQYYTSRPENIIIENGILKITAKKESYQGASYTSARILSQDLVDFKYCKLEVKAKLPTGVGTWPAIWMLGSNINEVSWPACGEIDIMEHVGRYQDRLYSTLHYPDNSGGNAVGMDMMVANLSTEFHTYTLDWTIDKIEFAVDGNVWHTISNEANIPFNQEFFMILNVAMGGQFGGPIDSQFSSSTMEVDYIKVYQ